MYVNYFTTLLGAFSDTKVLKTYFNIALQYTNKLPTIDKLKPQANSLYSNISTISSPFLLKAVTTWAMELHNIYPRY